MNKKLRPLVLALALAASCMTQASALEFTIDGADDYLFGRPTSTDTAYVQENQNVDRSKNTALIAPGFGTPTSYLPGSGEYLTPNLVPGALSGGLVNQVGSINPSVSTGQYPTVDTGDNFTVTQIPSVSSPSAGSTVGFTEVTSDLYYSGGYLGTLKIPSLGVNVKIYEGTDSAQLAKGAGHFTGTSIWSGNVCVAGHNRGTNCYFGDIHTLNPGDTITLTTKLGTRTYAVTSVTKVNETDTSGTAATSGNQITLYTCVRDQSAYRWCVVGVEV